VRNGKRNGGTRAVAVYFMLKITQFLDELKILLLIL